MNPTLSVYRSLPFPGRSSRRAGPRQFQITDGWIVRASRVVRTIRRRNLFRVAGYVILFVTTKRENDCRSYVGGRFVRLYSIVLPVARFKAVGSITILAGSILIPFAIAQFTERWKVEFGRLATSLIRRSPIKTATAASIACVFLHNQAMASEMCGQDAKLRWAGSGSQTTRPFHVDGAWEIQWKPIDNDWNFSIEVHQRSDPKDVSIAANQIGNTPGSAYQPSGGDFYLEISGGRSWIACVVSVP